MWCVL
jgi:hypothetical protein